MKWLTFVLSIAAAGCSQQPLAQSSGPERWILTGTKIYAGPDVPPIEDAWVLVEGSTIKAIGDASVAKPANVRTSQTCSGGVITAGFQNSHVHFVGPAYDDVTTRPSADLEQALSQMLTRFGYTTVVDTGSDIAVTAALRQRIESGEIKGPAIFTTGIPIYPENGLPFYLRDLPPQLLQLLAQPATAEEAVAHVRKNFERGADGIKLFVATPQGGGTIKRMSADIARDSATAAHSQGRLVMAHPTDPQGVADAVAAGVDILVHTTIDPPQAAWSDQLISDMVDRNVAVIPTLKLWRYEFDKAKVPENIRERAVGDAERQLKRFSEAGGQVLFGTDVGYMTDFDPTDEYILMARAGLTPMQILASLTTAPATRWSEAARRGRVKVGLDADLVVLNGDPAGDVRHFSSVRCTIRAGREIFVGATR